MSRNQRHFNPMRDHERDISATTGSVTRGRGTTRIDCLRIVRQTAMAICVDAIYNNKGITNMWFPISTVHKIVHDPEKPYIIVDEWLAKKKGLTPK